MIRIPLGLILYTGLAFNALLPHGSCQGQIDDLPLASPNPSKPADWLVQTSGFKAGIYRTSNRNEIALDNGLIRRTFRVRPNAATVGFDNLMTGESMLRGVKPEAVVTIDQQRLFVGGLTGQPNYAFLLPAWIDEMESDPAAMQFSGFHIGRSKERFAWKRVRHHAKNAKWPPKGVYLRMDYVMPTESSDVPLAEQREVIWRDNFASPQGEWKISLSEQQPRTSFTNEGKTGEISARSGFHCYAERSVTGNAQAFEVVIDPGTDQGVSWGPGFALVFDGRVIRVSLRSGDRGDHGHFELRDNGVEKLATVDAFSLPDGGIDTGKSYRIRALRSRSKIDWSVAQVSSSKPQFHRLFSSPVENNEKIRSLRVGKMDRSGGSSDDVQYPGEWGRCRIVSADVFGNTKQQNKPQANKTNDASATVSVHYEMYDDAPVLCKWLTIHNNTQSPITVNRFTSEMLAVVEHASHVEARESVPLPQPQCLHVETDFAFGGMSHANANRHVVHWRPDPQYTSQVNYKRETPCLLTVAPTYGPAQTVLPGKTFESFRTFELAFDSSDRERRGLALRRMYRTIAPWSTENPLMHHLLNSNPDQVKAAIDQAAEVGFEMIILSFGSGFNMDNENAEYLKAWKEVADYAHQKGIEIGSYSLLSSRGAPAGNMIVSPEGQKPTHGRCPALTSEWGREYFQRLQRFYDLTGFDLLEHDGSYPGDVDVTPRPPYQKGEQDSRWAQWRIISNYYRWCRAKGIYLNVPDYYFLNGANKTGMGYREVNWSLPRAMQIIHTRQNIFDGTWSKTPSMGWMFVPLAQYHGGGAAATVEPLHQHLDHYQRMIDCNLALGTQACFRGPRLFDTEQTMQMVKGRVAWFKEHRDILESDLIHGRRADGHDLDWMLHVNPELDRKGMLIVFNPRQTPVSRDLLVNLYYTGLTESVTVTDPQGKQTSVKLNRDYTAKIRTDVPAEGMAWYVLQ